MKKALRLFCLFLIVALFAASVPGCGKAKQLGDPRDLAEISLENERYEEAIIHFEAALKLKPNDPQILLGLGKAHLHNRAFEKAADQFEKVLELDDGEDAMVDVVADAHLNMADAEILLGRKAASSDPEAQQKQYLDHYIEAQAHCSKAINKYTSAEKPHKEKDAAKRKSNLAKAHLKLAKIFGLRDEVSGSRDMAEQQLEEIEEALSLNPDLVDAYIYRADVLYRNEKKPEAMAALEHGLKRIDARLEKLEQAQGNENEIKEAKADRFKLRRTTAMIQTLLGKTDEAIKIYEQIKELGSSPRDKLDVLYKLGQLYLNLNLKNKKDKWETVEGLAAEIQNIDQRNRVGSYLMGRVALGRCIDGVVTDPKERIELLDKAEKELSWFSDSKDPETLFWLGKAYVLKGGRDPQALAEFRKALEYIDEKKNPDFAAMIHLEMSEVLWQKALAEAQSEGGGAQSSLVEEAWKECMDARKLRPADTDVKMSLALILAHVGNKIGAKMLIDEVLEIEPLEAMTKFRLKRLTQLAQVNFFLGRVEQALQGVDKAIELVGEDLTDAGVYFLKGNIHFDLRQYEEAIESYKRAKEGERFRSAAHWKLALAYTAGKQEDKAVELLKKYVKEHPDKVEAPVLLARAYEKQGEIDIAVRYYEEALARDKDNKHLGGYAIARLYLTQGKIDKAIEKWREKFAIVDGHRKKAETALEEEHTPLAANKLKAWQSLASKTRNNIMLALMLKGETKKAVEEAQHTDLKKQASLHYPHFLISLYAKDYESASAALDNATGMTDNSKGIIKQFIQDCKNDSELGQKVITKLARSVIDRDEGWPEPAKQYLKEAIELMPTSALPRVELLDRYLRTRQFDKFAEECNEIIKIAPNYARSHFYLGELAEIAKDIDRAIAEYEKAAKLDDELIPVRLKLAELEYKRKKYRAASTWIDEAQYLLDNVDPDSNEAVLLQHTATRLQIKIQRNIDPDAADTDIIAEYNRRPDDAIIALEYASLCVREGKRKKAIEVCDKFLAKPKFKLNIKFRRVKAQALRQSGQLDDAARVLDDAINIDNANPQLYIDFARIYRPFVRYIHRAEKVLSIASRRFPESFDLKLELAETYIHSGKLNDADDLIKKLDEIVTQQAAKPDEAGRAKDVERLKLRLEFERALKLEDGPKKTSKLNIVINEAGKMAESADKAEAFHGHMIRGRVYLSGLNDNDRATSEFEKAAKLMPNNPEPYVQLAPIYFERETFMDCIASLEKLQKDAFTKARTAVALQADGKLVQAEETAREALLEALRAEKESRGDVAMRVRQQKGYCAMALANILLDAGKANEASETIRETPMLDLLKTGYDQLVRDLERAGSRADSHAVALALNKGLFFTISVRYKLVPEYYTEAKDRAPRKNVFLLMRLATSYDILSKLEPSKSARRNMLKNAEEEYNQALELKPDSLLLIGLLGDKLNQQGKTEDAIEMYQKGLDISPEEIVLMMKIGIVYNEAGNFEKALEYYGRILKLQRDDVHANYCAGRAYQELNKVEEALVFYDNAIKYGRDKNVPWAVLAYNNSAWLLAEKGGPAALEKALKYANAAKKMTHRPEIRDTLGWVLYKSGHPEAALNELKIAVTKPPTDKDASVHYHYAAVLAELDRDDEAIDVLRNVIDKNLQFSLEEEKAKAQELLGLLTDKN